MTCVAAVSIDRLPREHVGQQGSVLATHIQDTYKTANAAHKLDSVRTRKGLNLLLDSLNDGACSHMTLGSLTRAGLCQESLNVRADAHMVFIYS